MQTPKQILALNAGALISRKCRETGTIVTLYDGILADLDTEGGRWQTVCETHGTVVAHNNRTNATNFLSHPKEWCEVCSGTEPPLEY